MIDLETQNGAKANENTCSPIIGRADSAVPTSADVHLYLSPATSSEDHVTLYADCEGFEGAERRPTAVTAASGVMSPAKKATPARSNRLHRIKQGTKHALKWASREHENFEEVSKRGYTVAEMYPRIFYAFSDVIVWVLETPRSVLSRNLLSID